MKHNKTQARLALRLTLFAAIAAPMLAGPSAVHAAKSTGGGTPIPGSGIPWPNGSVTGLWKTCRWAQPVATFYAYTDPGRTVSEGPPVVPARATATVPFVRSRNVSFTYLFYGLDTAVPPTFDGIYRLESTRVTVHRGPDASYGVMSDRTNVGPQNYAEYAATVGEGPLLLNMAFSAEWTVRVQTQGKQWPSTGGASKPATLTFDCSMQLVTPNPLPPVFTF